jgi:PLP dependent protein
VSGAAAQLREHIDVVRERVEKACARAGRDPGEVRIVAVTKTHAPEVNRRLLGLGVTEQGESRPQDLVAKADEVPGVRWHLVGRLQRNKARDVVGTAAMVHSVDRGSLVDTLARRAGEAGVEQAVLIQVNVGGDPAKAGCRPEEALDLVRRARDTGHLDVRGLMTIPPAPPPGADANEHAAEHFGHLRRLRDEVQGDCPEVRDLSMGMSDDLESAVEAGATIVRIGRALLGPREDPPWEPR